MLAKWFSRKRPYVEHQASASDIRLLGELTGNGLDLLRTELRKILQAESNTTNAYLTKIQYAGEERIRAALVIDGRAPARLMAENIARACETLVAIDVLFLESLPGDLAVEIERTVRPFYSTHEA